LLNKSNKNRTTLIQWPSGISGTITIANSVTRIERWAFANSRLTNITIPNSVTHIGDGAFAHSRLTNITIPNSVTYIGNLAFVGNWQLSSITIPDSVTKIGGWAFMNNKLSKVVIPDNVDISRLAFSENEITSIIIGSNITLEEWRNDNTAGGFNLSFAELYVAQGRMAGTYIYHEGSWSFQPK